MGTTRVLDGRREGRRARVVLALAAVLGGVFGLGTGISPYIALVPIILAVPVIFWIRPHYIIVSLVLAATEIEEFTYTVGSHKGTFTDNVPLFRSVFHGMIILPIEIVMAVALLIWILKASAERTWNIPRSPLPWCFLALGVLLLVALFEGLSHGAQLKMALFELRSWMYLCLCYLLAAALLRTRKAMEAVLWGFILGTGFKGLQGTYIFFAYARRMKPQPEEILGHEEALFFSIFLVITMGLWLYGFKGHMRTTATWLFPFVLIADMGNSRRVAWLILVVSLAVMFVIAWPALPHRRTFLKRAMVILGIVSAVYFPLFWNHSSGTLAQPARAFHSAVQPDARDKSSNLYRIEENYNLIANIKGSSKLGRGFGIEIQYNSYIVNISNIDSMIDYIPHDGLLWVWMRMGMQGEIALWCLIGAAIIRGCRLALSADTQLALIGSIITCSIVGWTIMGYEDMGFAWFRIAVGVGVLFGMLEAGSRMAAQAPARLELPGTQEDADAVPSVALSARA